MDPSFFKPLVGDFPKKLLIPPAFVQKMQGKLASNLVLKCEKLYTVKIEELEEKRFFFVNGWPQFVTDHGLEYGDFIVFRLVEDSTFQVTIYDPSMCEKDCCDSHQNNNGGHTTRKPIKVETNTSSLIDLTDKNEESVVKIEIEIDDEPKDPCSDTDAPSFTLLLNEANKMYLPLPSLFARKTGLAKRREIKVRDPDGKKWPVKIIREGKTVGLTRGWTGLFIAHRLKKGDTCIFKYLGVDIIQVIVKRGRGRPPNSE